MKGGRGRREETWMEEVGSYIHVVERWLSLGGLGFCRRHDGR